MNIRDEIVARRRARIRSEGHSLGVPIPARREAPLIPFGAPPGVICEVKRRSPSKGDISTGLDPVKQVSLYAGSGITSVSVLTEEDHFSGSLEDLLAIKRAYPGISALRKDFLVDLEDIEVSYRAGADAVLLIASVLDGQMLKKMHARAEKLGMAALVEVHDTADIDKVRSFTPTLVGINSRNLETFTVDPMRPIVLKAKLCWRAQLVYESGIHTEEDARFASASGFACLLVGEAVVRNPALAAEIIRGKAAGGSPFWADLFARSGVREGGNGAAIAGDAAGGGPGEQAAASANDGPGEQAAASANSAPCDSPGRRLPTPAAAVKGRGARPLVKICGLTRTADVEAAIEMGACALGFVFARSPRRADPALLRAMGKRPPDEPVRVGVVVSTDLSDPGADALELLEEGLIDAIQFHGDEAPADCYRKAFPYYKALNLRNAGQAAEIKSFSSPRVLIDAHLSGKAGGTGARVPEHILEEASKMKPLWLAGGLNPENIGDVVRRFSPELVDVSSGVEQSPGCKDHDSLRKFFDEIGNL